MKTAVSFIEWETACHRSRPGGVRLCIKRNQPASAEPVFGVEMCGMHIKVPSQKQMQTEQPPSRPQHTGAARNERCVDGAIRCQRHLEHEVVTVG